MESLSDYGLGLELAFLVNAVYSVWGGLYRNFVKRLNTLGEGAEKLDSELGTEHFETIALGRLHKTIKWGHRCRDWPWFAARGFGFGFAVCIYVGSVSFSGLKFSEMPVVSFLRRTI